MNFLMSSFFFFSALSLSLLPSKYWTTWPFKLLMVSDCFFSISCCTRLSSSRSLIIVSISFCSLSFCFSRNSWCSSLSLYRWSLVASLSSFAFYLISSAMSCNFCCFSLILSSFLLTSSSYFLRFSSCSCCRWALRWSFVDSSSCLRSSSFFWICSLNLSEICLTLCSLFLSVDSFLFELLFSHNDTFILDSA